MGNENESGTGTTATETGHQNENEQQNTADQTATGTGTEKPGEESENQTEDEGQAAEEAAERERKSRESKPGTPEFYEAQARKAKDGKKKLGIALSKSEEARIRAEAERDVLRDLVSKGVVKSGDKVDSAKQSNEDPEPDMPLMEDFESSKDYQTAMKQYNRDWYGWQKRQDDRESKAAADRKKQEEDAAKRNQTASERETVFASRRDEILNGYREEFGDEIADQLESSPPDTPKGSMMQEAIWESEHAPRILKYLFDHKDEAAKIARMSSTKQAVEIDRIEKLVTAPPKKTTNAPAPVRPGSGGTSIPRSIKDAKSSDERFAIWEQEERDKGRKEK